MTKRRPTGNSSSVLFTAENAAEMARRSHLPTSRRFNPPPPAEPSNPPIVAPAEPADSSIQVARTREIVELLTEQIDTTRQVLRGKLEPRDRAQLLGALDRLIERERIMRCIAAPAPIKAGSTKARPATVQPIGLEPGPTPPGASIPPVLPPESP